MCRSLFMYLKAGGRDGERRRGGEEKGERGMQGCRKEMQTTKWKRGDGWRKTRGSELARKRKRKRGMKGLD